MLRGYKKQILLVVAAVVALFIWVPLLQVQQPTLTVAFLDVGQGDAVFITTPSGRQLLVDGGAGNAVLRELGRHMSWLDRSIDVVVVTHPDADHVGGIIQVLQRFSVDAVLRPGVRHDTPETSMFNELLVGDDTHDIYARRGQVIDFGDGVTLTILFPDRDVSNIDVNSASVVAKLTYGNHNILLTGDAPQAVEKYLVALDEEQLASNVLKVGHHGSRTSTNELFVGFVKPEYAIISRGCGNRYGHPHEEVIEILTQHGTEVFDTCIHGGITLTTDGTTLIIDK